jgi:hypothetical protein
MTVLIGLRIFNSPSRLTPADILLSRGTIFDRNLSVICAFLHWMNFATSHLFGDHPAHAQHRLPLTITADNTPLSFPASTII